MKYENEITVSVNMSRKELIDFLTKENYTSIDNYVMDDIYYVEGNTDLKQNSLEVLKKCILIRSFEDKKHYLVYKYKEYDENENIIKQGKSKVQVNSVSDAKEFLREIGYKELIHITDILNVYEKDGLQLCIEYVNDKDLYIEVEESEKYNTIQKLIEALEKTNIPYDKSNYFVKKAKIILEENNNR